MRCKQSLGHVEDAIACLCRRRGIGEGRADAHLVDCLSYGTNGCRYIYKQFALHTLQIVFFYHPIGELRNPACCRRRACDRPHKKGKAPGGLLLTEIGLRVAHRSQERGCLYLKEMPKPLVPLSR